MSGNRNELRDQVYAWLDACADPAGEPVSRRWRTVLTDTESPSGFGPVCPAAERHPLLDYDMGRDTDGVYDCCPHVVETFSEPLASFLVELLNRDSRMNPEPVSCPEQDAHPAHDWHRSSLGRTAEYLHCLGKRTP